MEVKNKFEKFLMSLSSIFLVVLIVMGFKLQENSKAVIYAEKNISDPVQDPQVVSEIPIDTIINDTSSDTLKAPAPTPNTPATVSAPATNPVSALIQMITPAPAASTPAPMPAANKKSSSSRH